MNLIQSRKVVLLMTKIIDLRTPVDYNEILRLNIRSAIYESRKREREAGTLTREEYLEFLEWYLQTAPKGDC